MPKKKRKVHDNPERVMSCGDLSFVMASGAKYDAFWHEKMTATELYQVFQSDESSILFCARLGWIEATSPTCGKQKCRSKKTTSYVYKRKKGYGRGGFDVVNPRVRYLRILCSTKAIMAQQRFLN